MPKDPNNTTKIQSVGLQRFHLSSVPDPCPDMHLILRMNCHSSWGTLDMLDYKCVGYSTAVCYSQTDPLSSILRPSNIRKNLMVRSL